MPKEKPALTRRKRDVNMTVKRQTEILMKRKVKNTLMKSCRLCTKNPGMLSMYDYVSDDPNDDPLPYKLKIVTGDIWVHKDDGLPDKICTECLTQLNSVYAFVLQMVATQKRLDRQIKGKHCTPGGR